MRTNGDEPIDGYKELKSMQSHGGVALTEFTKGGLTKRELFAAMAMQGLLADHTIHATDERFAEDAVAFADALIAELNKEQGV